MIIPNFYKRAITGRLEVKLCQEQLEISDLGRICFIDYSVMSQESPVILTLIYLTQAEVNV